ncbi:MAG TPA: pyruvate kinase [Candidatus Acidoferrales bacterium]|nr:pyruvate kinase [Candidatus Acidoferrales bacterium]
MRIAEGNSSPSLQRTPERRAKIVCTIGPACNSEEALTDLMRLGMDVARLNFSHGTHELHAQNIARLRKVAVQLGRTICILQDLQGPKIRTGRLRDHTPVMLQPGARVTITNRDIEGTPELLATTFTTLAKEVQPGARILLSDGRLSLKVTAVHGDDVECEVVDGGLLGEHQGINLPGTVVTVPSLTEKDLEDLRFGVEQGVDAVALSFVRTADDVRNAKQKLAALGADTPVIAKLEKPQAIDNLEAILEATDGVMVARGDLGVEVAPEKVPVIQKHVIRRAQLWRKPVITATQMLESMIENPRPTRAEASDVANAIFDGTDAVMLSGETATGKYPREAVSIMSRIVVEAEEHIARNPARMRHAPRDLTIGEAICESVAHMAEDLKLSAIAVFTESGNTARLISEYRPRTPVYAFSQALSVRNRLNLYWGVHPGSVEQSISVEQMTELSEEYLVSRGVARKDDVIAIVAGTLATTGSTNFIFLRQVLSGPVQVKP